MPEPNTESNTESKSKEAKSREKTEKKTQTKKTDRERKRTNAKNKDNKKEKLIHIAEIFEYANETLRTINRVSKEFIKIKPLLSRKSTKGLFAIIMLNMKKAIPLITKSILTSTLLRKSK